MQVLYLPCIDTKTELFLGLGVSTTIYPNTKLDTIFNETGGSIIGNIPISLGLVITDIHQIQLEYYFEDYFPNDAQIVEYQGNSYLFPPVFINDKNVFRLSYSRILKAGKLGIAPKAGLTFAFLGELDQAVTEIEGSLDGFDYNTRAEVIEYQSFMPFLAFGLDVSSPRFLKSFTAVLSGYYNLGLKQQRTNVSFELDGELVYENTIDTSHNHLNLMVGLRYYLPL